MPSDHLPRAPKRHIPKWPFWLGDALLLTAGIALAFVQGTTLTPWAMACIVTAIALGAIIACAPYAIEHIADAMNGGPGGDWAETRNKLLKLEFRLAEMELNGGMVPESARLAHGRFNQSEDDLGVGEVVKQSKKVVPEAEAPANSHFNFGKKGTDLVGTQATATPPPAANEEFEFPISPIDPETGVGPAIPQSQLKRKSETAEHEDEEEQDLPTSLDDIGPAENHGSSHLKKALSHARKGSENRAVQRLIKGGQKSATG